MADNMDINRPADDYTIEEAAKWLGVGRNKIFELCDAGWLVKYNFGARKVRITRRSLADYMHELCPSQYPPWSE